MQFAPETERDDWNCTRQEVSRGLRPEKMRSSAKGTRATLFFWRARSVEDHAVACHHSRPASALQLLTYY